jgi:hypothetical protein
LATFFDLVVVPVAEVVVSELAPMVVEPDPLLPIVVELDPEPAPCAVDVPDWVVASELVPLVPAVVGAAAVPVEPAAPAPVAAVAPVPVALPAVPAAVVPAVPVALVPLVPALTPAAPVAEVPALVPACDHARPKLPAKAAAMTVRDNFLWIGFMVAPYV